MWGCRALEADNRRHHRHRNHRHHHHHRHHRHHRIIQAILQECQGVGLLELILASARIYSHLHA